MFTFVSMLLRSMVYLSLYLHILYVVYSKNPMVAVSLKTLIRRQYKGSRKGKKSIVLKGLLHRLDQ